MKLPATGLLLLCILSVFLSSKPLDFQGAWNISYISPDSLNANYIGKELRIDCKRNSADTLSGSVKPLSIRKLLSRQDTVKLVLLNNDSATLVERWRIYPDHGVVSEQYLQRIDPGKGDIWIKEIYLRSITRNYLSVEVFIYSDRSQEKQEILIPKALVKGVLVASGK